MKVCTLEQSVKQVTIRKPQEILQDTIRAYEEAAKFAKKQQCGILVCPEMGLCAGIPPQDRLLVAEVLPQPGNKPDPCQHPTTSALAKIAEENSLYLVVSTIEKADAFYNTILILTPNGYLAGRPRKMHLYLEPYVKSSTEMSQRIKLDGIGEVEFVTCFDVYFAEANRQNPCDLGIMVTHWYDEIPNLTLLSVARGWAIANKTPLIVSNCRFVEQATLGAGIFHPNGNGQYSMSFSKDSQCVHVFDMEQKAELVREPKDVITPDRYNPIISDLKRFDKVLLESMSGNLKIDLPTISCQVMFKLRKPCQDVIYFMLAADGNRRFGNGDRLYLQELYIVSLNQKTRQISMVSGSPFRYLRLTMTVKNENKKRVVFPLIVGDYFELVPPNRWRFDLEACEMQVEGAIVCAGMCRRVFNKDVFAVLRKRSRTM